MVVGPARDARCFQGSNTFKGGRRERKEKPKPLPLPLAVELELTAKSQNGYFVPPWGITQSGEDIISNSGKRCLKK